MQQHFCFQNNKIQLDRLSSFRKPTVTENLNKMISGELYNSTRLDGNEFLKFDLSCMKIVFEKDDYKESIIIGSSIEGV